MGSKKTVGDVDVFVSHVPFWFFEKHIFAVALFEVIALEELIVIASQTGPGRAYAPGEEYDNAKADEILVGLHSKLRTRKKGTSYYISLQKHKQIFWRVYNTF